jgi:PAS domain S-box-containing protein
MVVRSAPIVLWAIDNNGVLLLSEGRGLDALGLKPGEVVGESAFDLYLQHPEVLEDLPRALRGESVTSTVEVGDLTFDTRSLPMRDAEGNQTGVIGVSTDVTDRESAARDLLTIAGGDDPSAHAGGRGAQSRDGQPHRTHEPGRRTARGEDGLCRRSRGSSGSPARCTTRQDRDPRRGTDEATRDYFRDVYDNLIRISDLIDSYRDLLTGAMDVYLSTVSNRLNVVMKQLTVLATIFLPLAFNFGWMVEQIDTLAAFLVLGGGGLVVPAIVLLVYFRRSGFM